MQNYEIMPTPGGTHLCGSLHRSISQDILLRFLGDLAASANRERLNSFLVDARNTQYNLTIAEDYEIGYRYLTSMGFRPGSFFAFVVDEKDLERYQFVETLMVNIGFRFRLFTDEEAAACWLKEKMVLLSQNYLFRDNICPRLILSSNLCGPPPQLYLRQFRISVHLAEVAAQLFLLRHQVHR